MKAARTGAIIGASLLTCCSNNTNDVAAESVLEWAKRNPPVSEATWKDVAEVECAPTRLDVCDDAACKKQDIDGAPPIKVLWRPAKGEYLRCSSDKRKCTTYQPLVSYSGSFMHAALPANGLMFWMTAGGEYREIANSWVNTFVYRGECVSSR